MKLVGAEADTILWAAEGLLLANSPTDAEAVEARKAFDTLMHGLAAERWQDNGPTTAELQRKRLIDILGPGHDDTLSVRGNLAAAYLTVGRVKNAIGIYEPLVADRERILGPDHPDTIVARNNLARAHEIAAGLS